MQTETIIMGGKVVPSPYHIVAEGGALTAHGILPLKSYLAISATDRQLHQPGVWLSVEEHAENLTAYLDLIPVIAIQFPKFGDGQGYSTARLLRRQGYRGDIRAFGDVLCDQLDYMRRCGFSSFQLKDGKDVAEALARFEVFPESYQEMLGFH